MTESYLEVVDAVPRDEPMLRMKHGLRLPLSPRACPPVRTVEPRTEMTRLSARRRTNAAVLGLYARPQSQKRWRVRLLNVPTAAPPPPAPTPTFHDRDYADLK